MARQRFIWGSIVASALVHAVPVTYFFGIHTNTSRVRNGSQSLDLHIEVEIHQPNKNNLQPVTSEKRSTPSLIKRDSAALTKNQDCSMPLSDSPTPEPAEDKKAPAQNAHGTPFFNRKPEYPEEARLLGIEGSVMLKINLSSQGNVISLAPLEPKTHPLLEQAAQEQVKSWRFPRSDSGYSIILPIKFELE